MVLIIQPHLAPRLKKEYTHTTAPPLCLHGRLHNVFIYYLPHFSSPSQKFMCTIISSEIDRMWFTWKAECGTIWIPHAQMHNLSGRSWSLWNLLFQFVTICHSTSMPPRNQCSSRLPTFSVSEYVYRHLVWLLRWGIGPSQILFFQWKKQIIKKCRRV
jgi:hypothetical protein